MAGVCGWYDRYGLLEDMVKLWNIPYEKNLSKQDDTVVDSFGSTPLMAYGFDAAASMEYFKSKLPQYKYETYDTAKCSGDEITFRSWCR